MLNLYTHWSTTLCNPCVLSAHAHVVLLGVTCAQVTQMLQRQCDRRACRRHSRLGVCTAQQRAAARVRQQGQAQAPRAASLPSPAKEQHLQWSLKRPRRCYSSTVCAEVGRHHDLKSCLQLQVAARHLPQQQLLQLLQRWQRVEVCYTVTK